MIIVQPVSPNPYINLALEEYLLHNLDDDLVMLWQSEPAVVIGKHQNAMAEVNYRYVTKNKIAVVRRLSGGGTVFHGPGNLNFTFIMRGIQGKLIDFKKYTQPVIDFLNKIGVPASFEGKNDLRVNGLKISGNAEHIYKNRVLHHGTLLYDADLDVLGEAIRVVPGKYVHKGVQSVRSQVANIVSFLHEPFSYDVFCAGLRTYLMEYFDISQSWKPTAQVMKKVEQLAKDKYLTWNWNFGYSPDYTFNGRALVSGQMTILIFGVSKGHIASVEFDPELLPSEWQNLEDHLNGIRHCHEDILDVLKLSGIVNSRYRKIPSGLMPLFF